MKGRSAIKGGRIWSDGILGKESALFALPSADLGQKVSCNLLSASCLMGGQPPTCEGNSLALMVCYSLAESSSLPGAASRRGYSGPLL